MKKCAAAIQMGSIFLRPVHERFAIYTYRERKSERETVGVALRRSAL
jgi:hypothetical protein